MYLLSAARSELKFFNGPESVPPPGFCILSHTWDQVKPEQTFQEIIKINEECSRKGYNSRDAVSEKIRKCCELAEKDGYQWVWIDTCCIDKTSSAELSEAINSMFRYYSLSIVCYVYLADVPADCDPLSTSLSGDFLQSRWHTRGWTLQELIAPKIVVFFSREWTFLGTKSDLAQPLQKKTLIPIALLCGEANLSSISVAQRMSWAAWRETSRKEDEAYCLLGIFNINMPTVYGEGPNAFYRLQKEIIENSADTTIFAWNLRIQPTSQQNEVSKFEEWPLFADSPRCFDKNETSAQSAFGAESEPQSVITQTHSRKNCVTFTMTPYGALARVPSAIVDHVKLIDLNWCYHRSDTSGPMTPIYPIITTTQDEENGQPLWHIGGDWYKRFAVEIPRDIAIHWETQELYIAASSANSHETQNIRFPCNGSSKSPFHFHFHIPRHEYQLLRITDISNVHAQWAGIEPAVLDLDSLSSSSFHLTFGVCTPDASRTARSGVSVMHWFRECLGPSNECLVCRDQVSHSCQEDHISETGFSKVYSVGGRKVQGLPNQHDVRINAVMKLSFASLSWAKNTLSVHGILIPDKLNVSPARPLTHTLDPKTNRILLHTDDPFPVRIAGRPISKLNGATYLGSAVTHNNSNEPHIFRFREYSDMVYVPCQIVLQDGVAKVFTFPYSPNGWTIDSQLPLEDRQHYGYYSLLAFDDKRMCWISWSRLKYRPTMWHRSPVVGAQSDITAAFYVRAKEGLWRKGYSLGCLRAFSDEAQFASNEIHTRDSDFEVLYWKEPKGL